MLHSSCRIDFCTDAVAPQTVFGHLIELFCAQHQAELAASNEASRVAAADLEGRLTVGLLVSALCDFRTRVELEHRRDQDLDVRRARGGGA